jgi:hypothetical protein
MAFFGQIVRNCAKLDHYIGLLEKRHFCRKLAKIAENYDHNIDPCIPRKYPVHTKLLWNERILKSALKCFTYI